MTELILSQILTKDAESTVLANKQTINDARSNEIVAAFEAGKALAQCREIFEAAQPGSFHKWCENGLCMSKATVYRYINIYGLFHSHCENGSKIVGKFTFNAVQELSKDTTPTKAIKAAIAQAKGGSRVNKQVAQTLIKKYTVEPEPPKQDTANHESGREAGGILVSSPGDDSDSCDGEQSQSQADDRPDSLETTSTGESVGCNPTGDPSPETPVEAPSRMFLAGKPCVFCGGSGVLMPRNGELPDSLDTPEFRHKWSEWEAYRRKKKLKKYAYPERQIRKLEGLGSAQAIAAIDYSIAQEFQGIYPENGGKQSSEGESVIERRRRERGQK